MTDRTLDTRTLDDATVDRLAEAVERRLARGQDLRGALGRTLRERAPVLLRRPEETHSSSSGTGWLIGLGLLAAVGAGLDYAARRLTGQNLVGLVKGMTGGTTYEGGYEPGQSYGNVHGTAGARMPNPDTRSAARPATPQPMPEPNVVTTGETTTGTTGTTTAPASGADGTESTRGPVRTEETQPAE